MRRVGIAIMTAVLAGGVLTPGIAHAAAQNCSRTGPAQREVEEYIAAHTAYGRVKVDGRQSAADCKAIKKLQTRHGISPSNGYAGTVTRSIVRRLNAAQLSRCRTGTRVCVDLTSQTMWMRSGGKVVLGPALIRTGKKGGYQTPAGSFRIGTKKRTTTSSYFGTVMPYWQQFHRDMGFHETPSYLHTGPGSHGCINLLRRDAVKLYELTKRGTPVTIFGRKPGT
jgi:lipoprotein-anchoring transpeptidase ErfK/SrfK